jgi:hypothetical protein
MTLGFEEVREEEHAESEAAGSGFLETARAYLVDNREVRWLIVFAALMGACNQAALWFYQPYFEKCGIALGAVGWSFAFMNVMASLSARHAEKMSEKLGESRSHVAVVGVTTTAYLLCAVLLVPWSPAFVLMHQWVRGFMGVYISALLNPVIHGKTRATVLSLRSMLSAAFYGIMVIPLGALAGSNAERVQTVFAVVGAGTLLLGTAALAMRPRTKMQC